MDTPTPTPRHAIVWLDREQARLLRFDHDRLQHETLHSDSGHQAPGGHLGNRGGMHGRGTSAQGRHTPQGGHETADHRFYDAVAHALEGVAEIIVTGPGMARHEFRRHCEHRHPAIARQIVEVLPSDHPNDAVLLDMARRHLARRVAAPGAARP